jgi:hypothetical protein
MFYSLIFLHVCTSLSGTLKKQINKEEEKKKRKKEVYRLIDLPHAHSLNAENKAKVIDVKPLSHLRSFYTEREHERESDHCDFSARIIVRIESDETRGNPQMK